VGKNHLADKGTDLDLLFRPRSLAVIGASPNFSKGGGFIWWRINETGYVGKAYPISRSSKELNGVPCYESISHINGPVDVAIAAIPAAGMEGLIGDCAKKGVKFTVIHAAGFAELGEEGKALQGRVLEIARASGMRLVGPNCMGIFCPEVQLNTIVDVDEDDMDPGGVAFCGQSGWATEDFMAGGSARGLKYSTVISSGNQADLGIFDYVSYFGSDPKTKVICAYTEGINQGRDLLETASEVGMTKPIIIWKSGFSQAGTRAAQSHSGSMAGNREIWVGAARKAGIIMADGFEDMLDMAIAFSGPLLPQGRKVGIVAEAGGGGISTADACEALGLEVNPFSPELQKQLMDFLKDYLPPFSGISNPLDIVWLTPDVAVKVGTKCLELVANEVDSIIFMSYPTFFYPELRPEYIASMCQLRDKLKMPIFVVPPYAARGAEGMKEFTTAGFPAFPSFERAARAVSATTGYQEWVSSRKGA